MIVAKKSGNAHICESSTSMLNIPDAVKEK